MAVAFRYTEFIGYRCAGVLEFEFICIWGFDATPDHNVIDCPVYFLALVAVMMCPVRWAVWLVVE